MKAAAAAIAGIAATVFLYTATDSRTVTVCPADTWLLVIPDDQPIPRYVTGRTHCVIPADVIGIVD